MVTRPSPVRAPWSVPVLLPGACQEPDAALSEHRTQTSCGAWRAHADPLPASPVDITGAAPTSIFSAAPERTPVEVLGCELHLLLREQDMVSHASLGGGPQGAAQHTLCGRRLALLLQVRGRTLGTEEPGPLMRPEVSRRVRSLFPTQRSGKRHIQEHRGHPVKAQRDVSEEGAHTQDHRLQGGTALAPVLGPHPAASAMGAGNLQGLGRDSEPRGLGDPYLQCLLC